MLKVTTVSGVALLLIPLATFVLLFTGGLANEAWDDPLAVMSWGCLVGTPVAAGSGTWFARQAENSAMLRVNLGVLALWSCVFASSLFIHF